MTDTFALPRKVIIFAILLPIAALVGFLLATPDVASIFLVGVILSVLAIPFMLRWHYVILIISWNLAFNVFFLPGSPPFWMLAGLITLGLTIMHRILDKNLRLIHVPVVTWSLLLIGAVVILAMKESGSLGLRAFGSASYGGKKYFFILLAVVAYFALSTRRIPMEKASKYLGMYFLTGVSPLLANIAFMLGPSVWFLFYVLPAELAMQQASEQFEWNPVGIKLGRLSGLGFASTPLLCYMLARFGLRGIFDISRLWRIAAFATLMVASTLGGFRAVLIINGMILAIQFVLEGLHKSRLFPALVVSGTLLFAAVLGFVDRLPFSVQRALSVLPINISPAVRADADASINWRLEMWRVLWPEMWQNIWMGKGYTASATDYYLALESSRRGLGTDFETSKIAGDYHSGFFSIMIPFGIVGMTAFVAFVTAGLHVLYRNYRYGSAALKLINAVLFSTFVSKIVFFFAIFGAIHSDLVFLAGLVGMSVSLNGGAATPNSLSRPHGYQEPQPSVTSTHALA